MTGNTYTVDHSFCDSVMAKTNVTISIDSKLAHEAKVLAAQRGMSLSRLVAEQIELLVADERRYEAAKRRAIRHMEEGIASGWRKPASRDLLHER